nr:sulfatase-like hydrolase/transferase [Lachnospiraceae bacterium]
MKKISSKLLLSGIVGILLVIIIMLLPVSTDVQIHVKYAKANSSYHSVLYMDNGQGFNESQTNPRRIKSAEVVFHLLKEYDNLVALRLDPVDAVCADAIAIKEIVIYAYDGVVKKYTAEQLGDVLIPGNGVTVLSCDGNGLKFQTEGADPQFTFSQDAVKDIRKSFSRNNVLALFALYFLLVGFVFVIFGQKIRRIYFSNKWKTLITIGQLAYVALFLLEEQRTYSGNLGFRMQTAFLAGVVLLAIVARLIWCSSEKSKPIATCVAFSVLAETVYGSQFFEKIFTPLAPDITLYTVSVLCAVIFLCYCLWNGKESSAYLWVLTTLSLFQFFCCYYGYHNILTTSLKKTVHYWSQHQCMITILILVGFYMFLRGVLGKGIALVVYTIVYLVFQVGNLIEMIFHQSVLQPMDFLAFTEALDVAKNYLNVVSVTALLLLLILLLYCLWKFRKQVADFLKPSVSGAALLFGAMLLIWSFSSLYHDVYSGWNIWSQYTKASENTRLKKQGYIAYFYYYSMRMKKVFSEVPENYNEESVRQILAPYETDKTMSGNDAEKPDVIYLMLESIFDVDSLEKYGVTYSQDPNPTLDQYQISTSLTSVYGGLTAKAEFEGLMGLSGSFYPDGIVEYLTFWGSGAKDRYSIVSEFEKNGYTSCAIHQNIPNYYNRLSAYESMGFDKYISSDTYGRKLEPEDRNGDKYLTNVHFLKLLKQQLEEETDSPKFIWGITIESHTPYMDKYAQTDIEAKCDKLSASAQKELTNYIQSVKRTDEFLAELIEYVEQRDKPTVIVMFGDHRPPLEALDVLGANSDNLERYSTACYAYSNFGEIEAPAEYISLNFIPALVVEYAGIEKSPFYSYLYDLQKRHPVVSNLFPDPEFEAEKENYRLLQHDIMTGEGYGVEF